MRYNRTDPLPVDWDAWVKAWADWKYAHRARMQDVPKAIPGKNFLADEIIGTYRVNGRIVELSAVTMPNFTERDPQTGRLLNTRHRFIGLTFKDDDGEQPVVSSFAELENALGLDASTA